MTFVDTLIVSDIHVGREDCNAEALMNTFESYSFKRLIANGDTHQRRRNLPKQQSEVLDFLKMHPKEVVLIAGNHDPFDDGICQLTGIKKRRQYRWNASGVECCARHGDGSGLDGWAFLFEDDTLDWMFSTAVQAAKSIKIGERAVNGYHDSFSRTVAERAMIFARRKRIQRMFCGHTHFPMEHPYPGGIYYNSGAWVDGLCTYITVDAQGNAKLHPPLADATLE